MLDLLGLQEANPGVAQGEMGCYSKRFTPQTNGHMLAGHQSPG